MTKVESMKLAGCLKMISELQEENEFLRNEIAEMSNQIAELEEQGGCLDFNKYERRKANEYCRVDFT